MNDQHGSPIGRRDLLGLTVATGVLTGGGSSFAQAGTDVTQYTLRQASELVHKKSVSPLDLTRACLDRIQRIDPRINSFVTVTADEALAQARAAEQEILKGGWRGPLHGIPIALKDLIDTAGTRTTGCSAHFMDRVPAEDAEVVRRLKKAGAVILGKLNMDEFAFSFTSETSRFGPVRNPWDRTRIPGGSSSGSGAAVAARLCYGALGSDTGGSIRLPASYCGIVGLKPTYGLVSKRGVLPLAWTLDHVGPMCRTVEDSALLLSVIAGYDPDDLDSRAVDLPDYPAILSQRAPRLRVGVPTNYFFEGLDPETDRIVRRAIKAIGELDVELREIRYPTVDENPPVLSAESYAYHEDRLANAPELYHPRIRRNLSRGADVSVSEYIRGLQTVRRLRHSTGTVFEKVDLVVTPTTPVLPVVLDEGRDPDVKMLRNTRPCNLDGLPAVSIPCGFSDGGLPVGLQISGPAFEEAGVLALANAYESGTSWQTRTPRV